MRNILFVIGTGPHRNCNHRRLPMAFVEEGWRVEVADCASRHLDRGVVKAADKDFGECALIWLPGFGERRSLSASASQPWTSLIHTSSSPTSPTPADSAPSMH